MKMSLGCVALLVAIAAFAGAAEPPPLIPRPAELHLGSGRFTGVRRIRVVGGAPLATAQLLASALASGGTTPPVEVSAQPADGDVALELEPDAAAPEAYTLAIERTRIRLVAASAAGLARGVQTLLQLAPDFPVLSIADRPRFAWRGLMVDVARHFRDAAWLHRVLDRMARYKLNVLHLHLTDDQGWRLRSAKFPRLTQHIRVSYTPEEIAALVAHAARLGIQVVPEIDVPGHVTAALAAYPDLGCRSVKLPVPDTYDTFYDVLCPGSESPFVLLSGLLPEVARQFPDAPVHLGGDQVPRARWAECPRCLARVQREHLQNVDDLQGYFLRRVAADFHHPLMVWDDDLAHGFPPGTVVECWHGPGTVAAALDAGHDVVVTPQTATFFDHSPLAIPLSRVLAFDPVPRGTPLVASRRVRGGEAALWSERLFTDADAERALFPRLLALAEVLWAPSAPAPDEFERRLDHERASLAAAGFAIGGVGRRVGLLTPRQLAGDWRLVRLDATPFIEGPGTYAFALGEDAPANVEMLAARLTVDGEPIAQLMRQTSTLHDVDDRAYELPVARAPHGRWTLELTVRCLGAQAAMASVWVEKRQ